MLLHCTKSPSMCAESTEATHMQTTIQPTSLGRISTIHCTAVSLLVHLQTFLQCGKNCCIRFARTSLCLCWHGAAAVTVRVEFLKLSLTYHEKLHCCAVLLYNNTNSNPINQFSQTGSHYDKFQAGSTSDQFDICQM